MAETTLFLIRHAHADWNPDEGRALWPEGQLAARHVAELLGSHPLVAVYASEARRALQTVALLAEAL